MSFSKYRGLDKHEGYMPKDPKFVHDNISVSYQGELFHNPAGYARIRRGGSFSFGVQKKIYVASGYGIYVDGYHDVGKSELE